VTLKSNIGIFAGYIILGVALVAVITVLRLPAIISQVASFSIGAFVVLKVVSIINTGDSDDSESGNCLR